MKQHIRITLMALALAIAVNLGFPGPALTQAPTTPANAALAFEKLKSLVGKWEATTDKGKASATYELVSGGSALLEHTRGPEEPKMITVYYLDGNRLLLTHYCVAGNQPRMQVGPFDPKTNEIDFRFLDATNLKSKDAGHMHHLVTRFTSPNEVAENWTFYKGGQAAFTVSLLYHRAD